MQQFFGAILSVPLKLLRLVIQTVFLALGQVWANKGRSVLTSLGIIIGVSAVIIVVGGIRGMNAYLLDSFDRAVGARKMFIWGEVPEELETTTSWDDVRLTEGEADVLLERSEALETLTPRCSINLDVTYGRELARSVRVLGVRPPWHIVNDHTVRLGREMSNTDVNQQLNVCIINEPAIDELKLPIDPVGEFVLLGGRRFLIIGVLEEKEAAGLFGGGDPQTELLIPFTTSKAINPYSWTVIEALVTNPDQAEEAREEVRFLLRNARGLRGDHPDTFDAFVSQSAVDDINAFGAAVGAGAAVVVSISLVVGGVGIMNIMLVSVSERTREIGLRKAVGAKSGVVLLQFLVEAVVLCLVGGAIGMAIGFAAVGGLKTVEFLEGSNVPNWAVFLAVGFSAGVGVVFGLIPALKAARLDPINALRHE
ncbi:MAG: ABC transporter permease [Planctomycetota bacterium]